MKHQRNQSIFQCIPVNVTQKCDPHLRRIHRSQFNLRASTALLGNISGTLHNFLRPELIRHSAFGNDRTRPVIFSCITSDCPQKSIRHRIHPATSISHEKSTSQPGDRCLRKYNHPICYKSSVSNTTDAVPPLSCSTLQSVFPQKSTNRFHSGMHQCPEHETYTFHHACA